MFNSNILEVLKYWLPQNRKNVVQKVENLTFQKSCKNRRRTRPTLKQATTCRQYNWCYWYYFLELLFILLDIHDLKLKLCSNPQINLDNLNFRNFTQHTHFFIRWIVSGQYFLWRDTIAVPLANSLITVSVPFEMEWEAIFSTFLRFIMAIFSNGGNMTSQFVFTFCFQKCGLKLVNVFYFSIVYCFESSNGNLVIL